MVKMVKDVDASLVGKRKGGIAVFVALAALSLAGVACWVLQLTGGGELALTNHVMWGIYIVGFMLCTGIAAGCLMFSSSTVLFDSLAGYRPYARIAAACAICLGVVGAGLFIMADLGVPSRFWEMIVFAQVGSPLFWDAIVLLAYLVSGVALVVQLTREFEIGRSSVFLKPVAIVAFVAGVCVAVTSFVFVFQVARPSWNNPGQTLSFVLSALAVSGAVLVMVFAFADRSGYLRMEEKLSIDLSRVLALALLAELVFVLAEVASGLFAGQGSDARMVAWLVSGAGAPFFWMEIAAFVASVALLVQKARAFRVVGAALAFFAVFLVKFNLLQAELFNPLLGLTGYPDGSAMVSSFYFPLPIEWGVTAGVVGISGLLLALAIRNLKLGA